MCIHGKPIILNYKGLISFCEKCKLYHLIFNNIYIDFTPSELIAFQNVVEDINLEYWETKYCGKLLRRKIPIQTSQQNLCLIFNRNELDSLKELISFNIKNPFRILSVLDIDYNPFLN